MHLYYIYKLTFPNGKVYIGQTGNFKARMREHKNSKANYTVSRAIRKYGWENIQTEILLTCGAQIDMYERQYIRLLKSNEKELGYNVESGGNLKKFVSLETRKKLSETHKGLLAGEKHPMYGKIGELSWNYGKTHSEETKQKMSKSAKGKKFSAEHVKNMSLVRKGKEVKEEVRQKISEAMKGKNSKVVLQFSLNGDFIKEWKSTREAEKKLSICKGTISAVCLKAKQQINGNIYERKSAGGFKWEYA